jgi:hypothetical protein
VFEDKEKANEVAAAVHKHPYITAIMTPLNSILGVLDLHMCRDRFLLVVFVFLLLLQATELT